MYNLVSQGYLSYSLKKKETWEQVWGVWTFVVWNHEIANLAMSLYSPNPPDNMPVQHKFNPVA